MKSNIEVLVNKNPSKTDASAETLTDIRTEDSIKEKTIFGSEQHIEQEVFRYLDALKLRNQLLAKENIKRTTNKQASERRTIRTPEAQFQNRLLRIVYQKPNISIDMITSRINRALAKQVGESSIEAQRQIPGILRGVESCGEAIQTLQKNMSFLSEEYNEGIEQWIGTNDELDAQHQIDLIQGIENKDGLIQTLRLVQVKSSTGQEKVEDIVKAHQEYLNTLPKFIGVLNSKEASLFVEESLFDPSDESDDNEPLVLDIEREKTSDQLALFGLVFDIYCEKLSDPKKASAFDFYTFFKKEGGELNPFTIMGILKSKRVMEEYCKLGYFKGNEKVEECLKNTADTIPYSEQESMAFYKEHHVRTILDTAEITSIVMVGGIKVAEVSLEHPLQRLSKNLG